MTNHFEADYEFNIPFHFLYDKLEWIPYIKRFNYYLHKILLRKIIDEILKKEGIIK